MPDNSSKALYAPNPFMGKAVSVNENGLPYDWQSLRKVVAKTADFSPAVTETGVLFVCTPTADIEATLPAISGSAGVWFEFAINADFELLITSAEGDNIVMLNNATADAISLTTATEHIGGSFRVVSDGTSWWAFNQSAGANTVTVVDA